MNTQFEIIILNYDSMNKKALQDNYSGCLTKWDKCNKNSQRT
jgi:hypothetical protein